MEGTKVTFRKFPDGEIIAVFPAETWGANSLTSYMHVGQHGGCDPKLLGELPVASAEERKELFEELSETIGYTLVLVD